MSLTHHFRLAQNDLSGAIPDILPDSLQSINLGKFESSMAKLCRYVLTSSPTAWNLFGGNIPTSLCNLTQLVSLDLGKTVLLLPAFALLENYFLTLSLCRFADINYFTGPLSGDFVKLTNLETLSIGALSLNVYRDIAHDCCS